jgi:hypothetical protein
MLAVIHSTVDTVIKFCYLQVLSFILECLGKFQEGTGSLLTTDAKTACISNQTNSVSSIAQKAIVWLANFISKSLDDINRILNSVNTALTGIELERLRANGEALRFVGKGVGLDLVGSQDTEWDPPVSAI